MDFVKFEPYAYEVEMREKPSFVQISASLKPELGGPYTVVKETSGRFSQMFRYSLIVFGENSIEHSGAITLSTFKNNRFGLRLRLPNRITRNIIRDAEILLIHGYYLYSSLSAVWFSRSERLFLMPHGSLEKYQQIQSRIKKNVFNALFHLALRGREVHFLVGSSAESVSVKDAFPKSRISVLGLGVNLPKRELEKVSDTSPFVLYCMSRITDKKRIDLCINAMVPLISKYPRMELRIYGTGDKELELRLKNQVRNLDLDEFVFFPGFVDDLEKIRAHSSSKILLLPSENENFAVAVAEAISFGNPVVVSSYVAMHDFVDEFKTGLTINNLRVNDLVNAIESIMGNYDSYSKNCFDSANQLSWDMVFQRWAKVFQ